MPYPEVERLIRDLGLATPRVRAYARAAVTSSARRLQDEARRMAPVDTGYLRSSITRETFAGGLIAEVGPEAGYGAFQEYGTSRMSPQPYMRPALSRVQPGFEAALAKAAAQAVLG